MIGMTFENKEKVGVHFELFKFKEELLGDGDVYNSVDVIVKLLKSRIISVFIVAGVLQKYVLFSAMLDSFLVGGLNDRYHGINLIQFFDILK